jgi:hypothetical protein
MTEYSFGAEESPKDIRTFAYVPTVAKQKGGTRYEPKDIDNQHKVGICTGISLTQMASKVHGIKFSPDFQYLLQKTEYDKAWYEGSSILVALKVAKNFGFLPAKDFPITEADRNLTYDKYIKKLQAITPAKIAKFKKLAAKYKILAYSTVNPLDRDTLAEAIDASDAGILARFAVGSEWWTGKIEPLRPPKEVISGHAVTESNYNGRSFRIANTWGTGWADKGTAYHLLYQYSPTEAWMVYFNDMPDGIQAQVDRRGTLWGLILDLTQKVVELFR